MAITRVTQNMMSQHSLGSLQSSLSKLAAIQEQVSTGRVLNRPSDSPSDTMSSMRMRSSISDQKQYARNAEDGLGWLGQTETALTGINAEVRRARDLALQGANGSLGQTSLDALAVEVDKIREGVLASANTTYLGRPVFGGITGGAQAYDPNTGAYIGTPGAVNRTIADGVTIDLQIDGQAAFGVTGSSLFDDLTALSAALRAGDNTAIRAGSTTLSADMDRIQGRISDVGTRFNRLEKAAQTAGDAELDLTSALSQVENTDLPKAMVELKMQEVAYQAALASTARVMQPSLLDFLR
jgi:flagellar hook-associated protein 3 FlgL